MISMEALLAQYPERLRGFKRPVLSEYLQSLILSYIFPLNRGLNLRFIGGTAIRLGWDSERFSEDLDFDGKGVTKDTFGGLGKELEKKLNLEGYKVEAEMSFRGAYRCFLKFPGIYYEYGLSQHPEEKLLIQIDYEPQDYPYEPQEKILNKSGVFAPMLVPPLPVLLSMKLSALLGRKRAKGRDFYDVMFLAGFTGPDFGFLKAKNGINGMEALRSALDARTEKLDMKAVSADVAPFLFSGHDINRVLKFREFAAQWGQNTPG